MNPVFSVSPYERLAGGIFKMIIAEIMPNFSFILFILLLASPKMYSFISTPLAHWHISCCRQYHSEQCLEMPKIEYVGQIILFYSVSK
jgi:hypothetical protein